MKADQMVVFELPSGKYDDGGDPANGRNVTEDGGCAGERPDKGSWWSFRTRMDGGRGVRGLLAGSAMRAKDIGAGCLMAALCTERHDY